MVETLLASAARVLWRVIEQSHVDAQTVFRNAGLDPAVMHNPRGRYSVDEARAAWREAARLIPDPCFGLRAAEAWRPTDLHALGYAFLASRDLRTGIERIVRYNAVVDQIVFFHADLDDSTLRLTYEIARPDLPDPPALQEARWAIVLGMCRAAYRKDLAPLEVAFTHPAPPCKSEHFGLFRCPVQFDAPVASLVFARAQLEEPLPTANRELARSNDIVLSGYAAELGKADIVSRVKSSIIDGLPSGAPRGNDIANDLHMSLRTLQRKLAEASTSYAAVIDATRRELAEQYLQGTPLPISEISYLLGFTELSSFSRAFRRWHGISPSEYRNRAGD